MPITTAARVRLTPGLSNTVTIPTDWLETVVDAVDWAVKKYLKRDIELRSYTEYYSGNSQRDIITRQFPVWSSTTTVAASSGDVALPTATINVTSTENFPPAATGYAHSIIVQTNTTTYTRVTYTGKTATTFTGCSGGTGTMLSGGLVATPAVYYDPNGFWGQGQEAFQDGDLQVNGSSFAVWIDSGGRESNRGLLRRIGGYGTAYWGYGAENVLFQGKLAAYRMPMWPRGDGNLKVCYSAGYSEDDFPEDLRYAATMLAAYMIRTQPSGSPLSSESLGGYSYSVMTTGSDNPDLGSINRIFARYRESSW